MSTSFAYHVFAHEAGRYHTTGASPELAPQVVRQLEQFFFGQTNDAAYLSSLKSEPGIIWRRVDNQFALTRVLNGKPDQQGRATLRFESVLLPLEFSRNKIELAPLVKGQWRLMGDGVSYSTSPDIAPPEFHAETVSKVVLVFRQSKRISLGSDGLSLDDVAKIIMLCKDDPEFSLCFKSLNDRAPVAVNLLFGMKAEKPRMSRPIAESRLVQSRPASSTFAANRRVAQSHLASITVPLLALILIIQILLSFKVMGMQSRPDVGGTAQEHILKRFDKEAGLRDEKLADVKTALADQLNEMSSKLDDLRLKVSELNDNLRGLQSKVLQHEQFGVEIEEVRQKLTDSILDAQQAAAQCKGIDDLKDLPDKLKDLSGSVTKFQEECYGKLDAINTLLNKFIERSEKTEQ